MATKFIWWLLFSLTLVTTVYTNPKDAMPTSTRTNLYESCWNLKSTGGGNMIDLTSAPFDVKNPVLTTTAVTFSPP